jgi:chitin disaccharide deacetylase
MIGQFLEDLNKRDRATTPGGLIITADDWGYSERYNAGILEAARAGAVDSVGAMVLRPACDPAPLIETGVEVGLHLELPEGTVDVELPGLPRRQKEMFETAFLRSPAYLDGHLHCHVAAPLAAAVEELALELGISVRAIDADHRFRLRERGIGCADRLAGRMGEDQPALPGPIATALEGGELPPGVTEWVVHPGLADARTGSRYDAGRERDLELLLELARNELLLAARTTHRAGLGR